YKAEDGIRDRNVTGLQTCALTICLCIIFLFGLANIAWEMEISGVSEETELNIREKLEKEGLYEGAWTFNTLDIDLIQQHVLHEKIGRASCRERVENYE